MEYKKEKVIKQLKKRISAKKWGGDDEGSWAVFIDGSVFVSGLTRWEVGHYKDSALKLLIAKWELQEGHSL